MRTTLSPPAALASFTLVNLDEVEATFVVRDLGLDAPQLLIDCSRLRCLRQLGVSYVVSQLLVLHQGGARVFLVNVDPVLHRCLRLLRLDTLFPLV
ncbi:hypothetical protein [Hymenobacter bucti]|uniref:STAS domain-containing protein n=1 Tax=Hymenobacter bucti TaxID=1844114 RepID=A0ABW4QU44_9BACT